MEREATKPMVLLDAPDDGYCEERGWVETVVPEDDARALLTPYCCDEDGHLGARPVGTAKRVWLVEDLSSSPYADERLWNPCASDAPGAREFYEFDATDVSAPSPEAGE